MSQPSMRMGASALTFLAWLKPLWRCSDYASSALTSHATGVPGPGQQPPPPQPEQRSSTACAGSTKGMPTISWSSPHASPRSAGTAQVGQCGALPLAHSCCFALLMSWIPLVLRQTFNSVHPLHLFLLLIDPVRPASPPCMHFSCSVSLQ